ncbi:pentapeptide repeat-containing protein [Desmonostoc muscorum LEGE 12446]|uniref:Pentapeptide repeat-containing protein n=1 Tax=Desmonostoc muscorum LEGE 12446 TaxID=1828758 RepID=A0A8J6ZLR3_DESMC|nr:pentapeptide repeat-containing protein [Desmonostoc muscorum]MCF2149868.1 pentapeptide repeat-containing protein [Desmonostoc muscorum LEGE 12446]
MKFYPQDIRNQQYVEKIITRSNFQNTLAGQKLVQKLLIGVFCIVMAAFLSIVTLLAGGVLTAIPYVFKVSHFDFREITAIILYSIAVIIFVIDSYEVISATCVVALIIIGVVIYVCFEVNHQIPGIGFWLLCLGLSIAFAWVSTTITALFIAISSIYCGIVGEFLAVMGYGLIAQVLIMAGLKIASGEKEGDGLVTIIAAIPIIISATLIARKAIRGSPKLRWIREVAVFWTSIGGTSFYGADLTDTCFDGSHLPHTDFRKANLTRTSFKDVTGLKFSRLEGTILENLKVRKLLVTKKGKNEDYTGANFNGANLTNADLTGAILTGINALDADFSGATLSYACIQEWNINKNTRFTGVKCSHVYLKGTKIGARIFSEERKPDSGEFQDGEFERWISELQKTIDLIFREGLNWRAFMFSLAQTAINHEGLDLSRYSITRDQNLVFAKIGLFSGADHLAIHEEFTSCYENAVKLINSNNQLVLQAKDEELERLRELLTCNYQIVRELASVVAGTGRQVLIQGTGNRVYMLNQAGDIMESKNEGINIGGNVGGNLDTGDKISAGGDMNLTGSSLTGNLNNVTNTNQQLSNIKTDSSDDLAKILSILQKSIGDDAALSESQKKEALEAVEIIAEEGKKPQGERALKFCSMAVNALKGLTSTVSDASKLAEVLKTHLPALTSILGL